MGEVIHIFVVESGFFNEDSEVNLATLNYSEAKNVFGVKKDSGIATNWASITKWVNGKETEIDYWEKERECL